MGNDQLIMLFNEVKRAISFDQPKLSAEIQENHVFVSGKYLVFPKSSEHMGSGALAEYSVKVSIPLDFPILSPIVFETDGAFPKNADYHCFPDERCCLGVPLIAFAQNKRYDIQSFFDVTMHNYFFGQWCLANGHPWPFGEYSHNEDGVREAYGELFECWLSDAFILPWLKVMTKPKLSKYYSCPCGSGKLIKNCCFQKARRFFMAPYGKEFRFKLVKNYVQLVIK